MQEYVEIGSTEPIESERLVEFHLLYSGPLHSGGQENPRKEKHAIRKVFHAQLRQLWESHPYLREIAVGNGQALRPSESVKFQDDFFEKGIRYMGAQWNRGGFNFLPLVTENVCLRCNLEILFLRSEQSNYVLKNGDIDGRLKILFDSLRMAESGELPTGAVPEGDEDPFFVLLQDDKLISDLRVNTDRLLKLPDGRPLNKSDVYLQITVKLNPTIRAAHSWVFE